MFFVFFLCFCVVKVNCTGLLLLYRPLDITADCANSQNLRYDISFGMGMSDTITLVFRSLTQIDYQCLVDINTESRTPIVIVIKYPTGLSLNCITNKNAFTVMKKNYCLSLCDSVDDNVLSPYYVVATRGRFRFRFLSNSSINADLNAKHYQVTATSARTKPQRGCLRRNETLCRVAETDYCFTTGVVCDGINNCGVNDWFDERKSGCGLPIEKLGFTPVIAVAAAIVCALLAAGHVLLRCLPPLANSFFIFNANEDNRLCIDPVFRSPDVRTCSLEKAKRISLIPVSSSSSGASVEDPDEQSVKAEKMQKITLAEETPQSSEEHEMRSLRQPPRRKNTIKSMTEKFQRRFRSKKSTVLHF